MCLVGSVFEGLKPSLVALNTVLRIYALSIPDMPEGRVWATNPPDLGLAVQRQPK